MQQGEEGLGSEVERHWQPAVIQRRGHTAICHHIGRGRTATGQTHGDDRNAVRPEALHCGLLRQVLDSGAGALGPAAGKHDRKTVGRETAEAIRAARRNRGQQAQQQQTTD